MKNNKNSKEKCKSVRNENKNERNQSSQKMKRIRRRTDKKKLSLKRGKERLGVALFLCNLYGFVI